MKKITIKSLLIAAALCLGTSAWAEETILYERGTTTAWSEADLTEWTGQYGELTLSNGLKYTSPNNSSGDYTKVLQTQDNSIIRVLATWNTGSSIGRAGNYNLLKCGNVEFRAYGQDLKAFVYIGTKGVQLSSNKSDVRDNAVWTISLEINKATGDVSYSVTLPSGKKDGEGTLETATFNELKIGFVKGGRTNTSTSTITAIQVTEEKQTVSTAEYTVKYVDNNKNEIKSSVKKIGVVGESIVLSDSDTENFFDVNGIKYIYVSDDASGKNINADGTTVVTVTFREADKYNYTVNAVNAVGEKLKELVTGSNFEGEKSRAYVTKGLNINGDWYITSGNGSYPTYGYDFTKEEIKNVTYTVDENVDYFFEVEDINKSRSWAATGAYPERYSNGKAGRLYKGAYAFTDALAGGVYTITLWARNNSSSAVANVGLYYRDTNGNATPLGVNFADWDKGKSDAKTLGNVIIPDGASLMLKNENPDYNSNLEMDYLIFTKTGEAIVSPTITAAGYATFSSTYAIDFSESGLTAYIATVNGNKVVMTPIENGIVPANTGVILKGAEKNYTGVITTKEAVIENNDLVAATEEINELPTTDGTYNNYILNVVEGKVGFYQANNKKVAAGKAYLQVPVTNGAKALTIVWNDGETTGIEENYEFGIMNSDAATYDLSGRKVANPAKGLYIKNGKKFIVK